MAPGLMWSIRKRSKKWIEQSAAVHRVQIAHKNHVKSFQTTTPLPEFRKACEISEKAVLGEPALPISSPACVLVCSFPCLELSRGLQRSKGVDQRSCPYPELSDCETLPYESSVS